MWTWAALLIGLLCTLCFSTRILWRLKYRYFGNDTWGLLNIARSIRAHRFRMPRTIGNYFNDTKDWDYPPLFPYLLALMKEETALEVNGYIPALLDTLSCAIVGIFLSWLPLSGLVTVGSGWPVLPGLDGTATASVLLPALGMLVVVFTPITCIDSFQHLSARPLANLLTILTLMLMFLYHATGGWIYLVLMLAPVTLIYLTHKFTLQALTFLNIGLLVALRQPWFILVQAAGFLLAVGFSGGHYLKVFRGQLAFLNYYRKMGAEKYPGKYAVDRQRLSKMARLDATSDPWIYFLIPLLLLRSWPPDMLTVAALTMVVAYLMITLNPLLFLGEPERYLETAAFPMAMLIPVFLLGSPLWAWALFGALLCLSLFRIYREMKGREEQMRDKSRVIEHFVDPEWLEACRVMRECSGNNILTVPENLQWATSYFTRKRTQGTNNAVQYMDYMGEFPATPQNIRALVAKYDIDMVFVAKAAMKGYDLSFARLIYENERYGVFEARGTVP